MKEVFWFYLFVFTLSATAKGTGETGWEVCASEQLLTQGSLSDFLGTPFASSDSASITKSQEPALARCDIPPMALPHQVPQESSCLYISHCRCRNMVFQGLPTWPSSGCALWLLILFEVRLCGSSFRQDVSGPWGEKQQSLHSSCAWFAQSGSQVCRYLISNVVPKSLCASGLCCLLTQGVF